jgi:acyl carrier protein
VTPAAAPPVPPEPTGAAPAPAATNGQNGQNGHHAVPVDGAALTSTLVGLIGDRTGYPPDVVGTDTDLQGELGIDSIKKVEILGMFQRAYGFGTSERPSAMESLSRVTTPREAVDVLLALLGDGAGGHQVADADPDGPARFVPVAEGAP